MIAKSPFEQVFNPGFGRALSSRLRAPPDEIVLGDGGGGKREEGAIAVGVIRSPAAQPTLSLSNSSQASRLGVRASLQSSYLIDSCE